MIVNHEKNNQLNYIIYFLHNRNLALLNTQLKKKLTLVV